MAILWRMPTVVRFIHDDTFLSGKALGLNQVPFLLEEEVMGTTRTEWSETDRALFRKNRSLVIKSSRVCAICGQPIDKSKKFPDPLSPSVDHIIPWAKGGRSTMDNLQATHFICNRLKSDKIHMESVKQQAVASDIGNRNLPQYVDWTK